jgi:hypothetical protein
MMEAVLPLTHEETKSKPPLSAEPTPVLSGILLSCTPKDPTLTVLRVELANHETPAV